MLSSSKEKEREVRINKKEGKVYITYKFDGSMPSDSYFDLSPKSQYRREKKMKVDLPFTNKSKDPSKFSEVTGYVKDYCIGLPGEDSENTTACQPKDTEDKVEFERKETWTFKQSGLDDGDFDRFTTDFTTAAGTSPVQGYRVSS